MKHQQRNRSLIAAWALFALLLVLWLIIRRGTDAIQPVDGFLFFALMIQVWLISRRVGGRVR